jgi:hypothetical protein
VELVISRVTQIQLVHKARCPTAGDTSKYSPGEEKCSRWRSPP